MARPSSPPVRSTLIMSAPRSERIMLAVGPATMVLRSRTRIPSSTGAKKTKITWVAGEARRARAGLAADARRARAGLAGGSATPLRDVPPGLGIGLFGSEGLTRID